MSRMRSLYVLGAVLLVCASSPASAGVIETHLRLAPDPFPPGQEAWDLYAIVTVDTLVLNADLGDETIDLPPDGVNTGLYSKKGAILGDSFVTLGGVTPSFARPFTIMPSCNGSLVDAAWFVVGGIAPEFDPVDGYRVWLGRFVADEGAILGGPFGGPNRDIQSRIFIGWQDGMGTGFGVFNIPQVPAPGSLALLLIGLAVGTSRCRTRCSTRLTLREEVAAEVARLEEVQLSGVDT